jgi:hypothetical protein
MTKPKVLLNAPSIMVLVKWGVGRPALAEIIPPNIRAGTEFLCEFAILHVEASVKTHRPEQASKV